MIDHNRGPQNSDPVVYTISDTHLGLRERGRNGHRDHPELVADFFRWLRDVKGDGFEIQVWEGGRLHSRHLRVPTHLILLGDVLELWDGENQSVLLSSVPVEGILATLPVPKIYVLGNHDNILESAVGRYPFGIPGLKIVAETYPEPDPETGRIVPLRTGGRAFLFVHGHQFDLRFSRTGGAWRVLGHLRQFAAALGRYAWIFLLLTLIAVGTQFLGPDTVTGWLVVAVLSLFWLPTFYVTVGRRFWKSIAGTRYRRDATLRGFRTWWPWFSAGVQQAAEVELVFGHTHYLDWFGPGVSSVPSGGRTEMESRIMSRLDRAGIHLPTLYNISSWVSTEGRHKAVVWATIFYADGAGPALLAWNWKQNRPMHVPFEFVRKRRLRIPLTDAEERTADDLGWPRVLIDRWSRDFEDV